MERGVPEPPLQIQVTVSGEAGTEKVKAKAKAFWGMLDGTVFKGNAEEAKATGTSAKGRARSETQRSAHRSGASVHPKVGGGAEVAQSPVRKRSGRFRR